MRAQAATATGPSGSIGRGGGAHRVDHGAAHHHIHRVRAESVNTAEDRFLVFPVPDFQIPDTGMEVLYRPADMEDGLETPMRFAVAKANVDIRKRDFRVLNTGIPARNMNVPYAAVVESGMTAGPCRPNSEARASSWCGSYSRDRPWIRSTREACWIPSCAITMSRG